MKKLIPLAMLGCSLLFVGCGSDDGTPMATPPMPTKTVVFTSQTGTLVDGTVTISYMGQSQSGSLKDTFTFSNVPAVPSGFTAMGIVDKSARVDNTNYPFTIGGQVDANQTSVTFGMGF